MCCVLWTTPLEGRLPGYSPLDRINVRFSNSPVMKFCFTISATSSFDVLSIELNTSGEYSVLIGWSKHKLKIHCKIVTFLCFQKTWMRHAQNLFYQNWN